TTVAVRVPLAAGWELDVTHLPYHPTEGLPAPVTSTTTVLAPLDGIVRVPIASLAAGDAWTFELRPIGPVLDEPAPTTTTATSTTTTPTTTTRPTTTTTAAKGKPGKPTATTTTQPTTTTAPKGKGKPRW